MKKQRLRLPAILLLICLILSAISLIVSVFDFQARLDEVDAADSDNQGWLISQLEVDHRNLLAAVFSSLITTSDAGPDLSEAELANVVRKFDIYYSRINAVEASLDTLHLPESLSDRMAFLRQDLQSLTTVVDSLTIEDASILAEVAEQLAQSQAAVRDLTTGALQVFTENTSTARERKGQLSRRFQIQSFVLLGMMVLSSFLAVRLWTDLEERSAMVHRASDTISKAYDASQSAVFVLDSQGRLLHNNKASRKIFELNFEDLIKDPIIDCIAPARHRSFFRELFNELAVDSNHPVLKTTLQRTWAVRASGEEFPVEVSLTRDENFMDEPIFIAYVTDISEQVLSEQKIEAALDEAEKSAAAKSMFLATMSHEMRTPLHGVIASLDLMDEKALKDEDGVLLKTARDCAQRALAQINDVLEMTRLGASSEAQSEFVPQDVVGGIVEELRPLATEHGNEINLVLTGKSDGRYLGAAMAFSRAISNLAGNAVKFTSNGKIDVRLNFQKVDGDTTRVDVQISDDGPGIPVEHQARIFDEFETLAQYKHSLRSGTGLGLAIARTAVDRLGGSLTLESEPGAGSLFSFAIELAPAPEPAKEPKATETAGAEMNYIRAKTLVVDDNEINRVLLCQMLKRLGHEVDTANDGVEAVIKARSQCFDVILMDVSMPVLDGFEATRQIRAEGPSKDALVIGVTAYLDQDEPRLQSSGMDDVLTKPLALSTLKTALETYLSAHMISDIPREPVEETEGGHLSDLQDLVGAETAVALFRQALDDAQEAIEAMKMPDASSESIAQKVHYAIGPTMMVGLRDLGQTFSKAENAAAVNDRSAIRDLVPSATTMLAAARSMLETASQEH